MGGGPIIIIDPNKVKSTLSTEDTIDRLRETADALESGNTAVEELVVIDPNMEETE